MSFPSFGFPLGAWFFLALIPLVVLYFLKLKRPRLEVPSLALWQSVVNDQRVNSPFQKFRRNLLLLLQLILLCLLVLALMQPFVSSGTDNAEFLPVLIDCSASMSATEDGSDETRLKLAKERVREIIDNRGNRKIALFSFSTGGRRLTEFTDDETQLYRALEKIEPTHRASRFDEVLRMADAYSRTAQIERVVVVTDGNLRDQVNFELPFELQFERITEGGQNLGITEFNARRSGPESWDVFVRVAGSSSDAAEGQLTLTMNDKVVGRESVLASNEDSERLVFSVDTTESSLLQATLTPDGFDSLDLDNNVWLALPRPRPLRIWAAEELYSWQHALSVLPDLDLEAAATPSAPEYDLIVVDELDLKGATAPIVIYNGVIPEELSELVAVADAPLDAPPVQVVDWANTAPMLRHVRLRDVQITEQSRYAEGANESKIEEKGFEVLVHAAEGPLVLQRRRGLETEYYFLFHTDRSTLPYRLAFPILVSNVIESAMQRASLSEVSASPTGVLPSISVEPDRDFVIYGPDGETDTLHSSENGLLAGIQGSTVGKYEVRDGTDIVASMGTGILSPLETSLRSAEELQFAELSVSTNESERIESGRQLWWILALAAFIFMLVEWWYFQRQRVGAAA